MKLLNSTAITLMAVMLLASNVTLAQVRPGPTPHPGELNRILRQFEDRIYRLETNQSLLESRLATSEQAVQSLNYRINELERNLRPNPPPYPAPAPRVTCMLVDTYKKNTYLNSGKTALEAETNVRRECSNVEGGSWCQSTVKCENESQKSYRNAMCVVVDTYKRNTYSGNGSNLIEAEAQARIACQKIEGGSWCQAAVKCETY